MINELLIVITIIFTMKVMIIKTNKLITKIITVLQTYVVIKTIIKITKNETIKTSDNIDNDNNSNNDNYKQVRVEAQQHQNRKDHFDPNLGQKFFWRFQLYQLLDILSNCNLAQYQGKLMIES